MFNNPSNNNNQQPTTTPTSSTATEWQLPSANHLLPSAILPNNNNTQQLSNYPFNNVMENQSTMFLNKALSPPPQQPSSSTIVINNSGLISSSNNNSLPSLMMNNNNHHSFNNAQSTNQMMTNNNTTANSNNLIDQTQQQWVGFNQQQPSTSSSNYLSAANTLNQSNNTMNTTHNSFQNNVLNSQSLANLMSINTNGMNMNNNIMNQHPVNQNNTIDSSQNLFNMLLGNRNNNIINNQLFNNQSPNLSNNLSNTLLNTNLLGNNPMVNNNTSMGSPQMNNIGNNWQAMENPVMSPNSHNRQFNNQSAINQNANQFNNQLNQFNNQNLTNNFSNNMNYNRGSNNNMNQTNPQNLMQNVVSYNMNSNVRAVNNPQVSNQQAQFQQTNFVFEQQSGYANKRRDSTPSIASSNTPNKKPASKKKETPKAPKVPKTPSQPKTPKTPSQERVRVNTIDILKPLPDRIIYYILHFIPSFPDYGSICQVSKRLSEICKSAYLQQDTLFLRRVTSLSNAKGALNKFYAMRETYEEEIDGIATRRELVSKEIDPNKRTSPLDKLKAEKREITKMVLSQVNVESFKKVFENEYVEETLKEFTLIGHKFTSNSLKQFFTSLPTGVENVTLVGCLFNLDLPFEYFASMRKDISPKMEILLSEFNVANTHAPEEKTRKVKKKKLEEENPNPCIPSWMKVQELKSSINVDSLKALQNIGLDLLTDNICDNISAACIILRYGDVDCLNYLLQLMASQSISPHVNMVYQTLLFNNNHIQTIMRRFIELFPQGSLVTSRFMPVALKTGKNKLSSTEKANNSFQSLLRVDQFPTEFPLITKKSIEEKQLTPYLCSCVVGNLEVTNLISPQPVLQIDVDSNTALHIACMNGSASIAKYLIEKNHSLDGKNNKAQTILHTLMLSPHGKDCDDFSICLQTILDRISQKELLINALSARDLLGNTCLHYAVENRHADAVKLLLQYYSKCDNVDNYLKMANGKEMTPLLLVFSTHAPRNEKAASILIYLMNNNFEQNFKQMITRKDEDGDVISSKTIFTEILECDSSFSISFLKQYLSVFPDRRNSILNDAPEGTSSSLLHYSVSLPKDTSLLIIWLIKNGANPKQVDESGKTFLHVAIEKEFVEDLDGIIEALASVLSTDELKHLLMTQDNEKKYTVLHQCSISDKYGKSCTKLISAGADISGFDIEKNTPLMTSIAFANYEASHLLLTNETKNLVNGNNVTPIILLLRNSKDLKHFLNEKEINQSDYNSSIEKLEDLVTKMLDMNVEISSDTILDYVDEDRPSALMLAIEGNLSMEIITRIIEHPNMFVNHQTAKSLVSPLHVACEEGYSEVVTLLIQKGANILIPDNNKSIPLIYAMLHSNNEVVKLLLEHVDTLYKSEKGASKQVERAKFFVSELSSDCLESLLLQAISENVESELVKNILTNRIDTRNYKLKLISREKDGDYTMFTDQGANILMVASQEGRLDIFKSYLQFLSTFETFNGGEFSEISEVIKLADQSNDTLVHYACMAADNNKSASQVKEKLAILDILVQHGAPLDTQNDEGNTPLHLACRDGLTNIARYLLKRGCEKNVTNNNGVTPDTLADDAGHYELLSACFDDNSDKGSKPKPKKKGTKRKASDESDDEFVASDREADSEEELDDDSMSDDDVPKLKSSRQRTPKVKKD